MRKGVDFGPRSISARHDAGVELIILEKLNRLPSFHETLQSRSYLPKPLSHHWSVFRDLTNRCFHGTAQESSKKG